MSIGLLTFFSAFAVPVLKLIQVRLYGHRRFGKLGIQMTLESGASDELTVALNII